MKKLFAIILGASALSAFAGLDTTGLNYVTIQAPRAFTNGTTYTESGGTNAVDISSYKGNAKFVLTASGNTTVNAQTNSAVVIQHANAATGTYSTAVTFTAPSASSGTIATASVDLGSLYKWVRVGVTLQGTNAVNQYIGVQLIAP